MSPLNGARLWGGRACLRIGRYLYGTTETAPSTGGQRALGRSSGWPKAEEARARTRSSTVVSMRAMRWPFDWRAQGAVCLSSFRQRSNALLEVIGRADLVGRNLIARCEQRFRWDRHLCLGGGWVAMAARVVGGIRSHSKRDKKSLEPAIFWPSYGKPSADGPGTLARLPFRGRAFIPSRRAVGRSPDFPPQTGLRKDFHSSGPVARCQSFGL